MPKDVMARTSPPPSDEAQPLNTRPLRIFEDIELRNQSFDGFTSSWSPPASTTYYSEISGGLGEADRAHTTPDSQYEQQCGSHHQSLRSPNQRENCIQRLWLWESLSIAVATLALTAIVTTLILRGDRPLPDWPSAITINALIAVFTAIFKACLLMPIAEGIGQLKWLWYQKPRPLRHMEQWDLASRGPWGSLLLISVLSCTNLAVIGAVLTILAMAIDPFTQQIVHVYSCLRLIEGERATVPFSNNYTAGSYYDDYYWWLYYYYEYETRSQVDPQMLRAMYVGLLNVSAALEFECRTGHCIFPATDDGATFLSLALESRCTDVSSDVSFSSETHVFNSSSVSFGTDNRTTLHANLDKLTISDTVMRSVSRAPTDRPSHFLSQVAFLTLPNPSQGQPEPQDIHAFACEFYPVVNTYSANITNGMLLEQVLHSQPMDVWLDYNPSGDTAMEALLIVDKTIREGKWQECTGNHSPSEENNVPLEYFHSTPWPVPPAESLTDYNITWWPRDCVYAMPLQVAGGLFKAVSSLLGNETLSYDLELERSDGSPWSTTLWNNGTPSLDIFQATMAEMTRSVTARLRQGDGLSVNMGPANGTVYGTQTCIRVKWVWLALPAGLLLFTIVFLLLTIVKTRSRQARIWKSSLFAVLFSGLDQQTRQADGPVASLEEMKAAAGRVTVRLEDTKEGLRLVSQGD